MMNSIDGMKCKATKMEDFLQIDVVEEAIKVQICYRLKRLLDQRKELKVSKKDFINSVKALDIVRVTQDHIKLISMMVFRSKIEPNPKFPIAEYKDPKNKQHMMNMLILYGLCKLNENQHGLYESGYFTPGVRYSEMILEAIKTINLRIRPVILPIVETWCLNDEG